MYNTFSIGKSFHRLLCVFLIKLAEIADWDLANTESIVIRFKTLKVSKQQAELFIVPTKY
jgi:hypothetical protein